MGRGEAGMVDYGDLDPRELEQMPIVDIYCFAEKQIAAGTTAVCDLLIGHEGLHYDKALDVKF